MAATMFAACSQTEVIDEVVDNSTPKAIGFTTYAEGQTRAENSDEDYDWDMKDHHSQYTVYGYKTVNGTNHDVFTGQEVNSTTGAYSPTKYWDKAASSYGFFAYAGEANFTKNDNGTSDNMEDDYFTIDSYTVPETNLNSDVFSSFTNSFKDKFHGKDLMIAEECNHTSIGSDVTLNFIHILSRLNVMVKTGFTTDAYNYIRIKAVEVHNLVADGAFDESKVTAPATLAGGTTERWEKPATPTTVDNKFNHTGRKIGATATNQYVIQALVMPQIAGYQEINIAGSDAESSKKPYIKITYSVTTGGVEQPNCTYFYNLANAFGLTEGLAFNEGWQNNLTITITPTEINFEGKVAVWDDNKTKDNFTIE
ncbi:MAG: fimbrillin family protein [Bacteroides sp.]|nr:fimbrillin family protein [Bacteroides sp.]